MNNNPFVPSQPTAPSQPNPTGLPPANPTAAVPLAPAQPIAPVPPVTSVAPTTASVTPIAPVSGQSTAKPMATPQTTPTSSANSSFGGKLPLPLPAIIGIAAAIIALFIMIVLLIISSSKENKVRSALDNFLSQTSNTIEFDTTSSKGEYAKVNGNLRYVTKDDKSTIASDIYLTYNNGKTDYGTNALYLVNDNGDETYFKLSLSDKLGDLGVTLNGINNQWYKMTNDEASSLAKSSGISLTTSEDNDVTCMSQKLSLMKSGKYRREVVNAIMDNHLLRIENGQKDSNGTYYEITFDKTHVKDTLDALAKTHYAKEIYKCGEDPSFDVEHDELKASSSDISDVTDYIDKYSPRIKVYLSGFARQKLDRAEIAVKNDVGVDNVTLKVANKRTLIGIPSDAKSSDDLEKALNDAFSTNTSSSSWLDENYSDNDYDDSGYNSNYLRQPSRLQVPVQLKPLFELN